MKKTFDQLFNEIVKEAIVNAGQTNPNQPQQQAQNNQQPPQPTTNQTKPDEVPDEIAKMFIAAKTPQEVNAAYMKLQQMKTQTPNTQANQQQYSNNNAANKQA